MGLWSECQCPVCMNKAVRFLWMVRCSNINCRHYHASMSHGNSEMEVDTATVSIPCGKVDTKNKLVIDYINHLGQENKYIIADTETIRVHKQHISVRLEPEGIRCTFKIDKIQNYEDILKASRGEFPVHDSMPHHSNPTPATDPAGATSASIPSTGRFQPGDHAVSIQYINFAGENKTFTADRRTVVKRNAHVSACLVPTGRRCNFKIENIQNIDDIQPVIDKNSCLTRRERRLIEHFLLTGKKLGKVDEALAKIS